MEGREIVFTEKYLPYENKLHDIDLLKVTLNEESLGDRLVEFQKKHEDSLFRFKTKIGNKSILINTEWFDSTSAYNKFYVKKVKDGFSMYTYSEKDKTILFFIELIEENGIKEMYVNYHFRYSNSLDVSAKSFDDAEFIEFLSKLSYLFKIRKVHIYFNYANCNIKLSNYELISGNYRLDFFRYLKTGYKRFTGIMEISPMFQYFQLDKLGELAPLSVLNIHDTDELYLIYMDNKSKIETVRDLYIFLIESHCYLVSLLEKKLDKVYEYRSNPFIYDYYVFDSYLYLYQNGVLATIPPLDKAEEMQEGQYENKNRYRL